jgi:hypothetical protein
MKKSWFKNWKMFQPVGALSGISGHQVEAADRDERRVIDLGEAVVVNRKRHLRK